MNENKYILLFEAFGAKTISKTIDFLDKQVGKGARSSFINYLKDIGGKLDIPFDKITDEYFEYLGKPEALIIRNRKIVDNPDGIFCLKFWFSIDTGYQGYTYTGNIVKEKNRNPPSEDITLADLTELGITKGTIMRISNRSINDLKSGVVMDDLRTGDKIIGIFSSSLSDGMQIATIFIDESRCYAIQEYSSGDAPISGSWSKYGSKSWAISGRDNTDYRLADNKKLARYIEEDVELNIDGSPVDNSEVEENVDVMEFNLPISTRSNSLKTTPKEWGESNTTIGIEKLEKSDFAIILYYDKLLSEVRLEKPSEVKANREFMKKGTYALIDNEEIKRANIERYMDAICRNFGLDYENEINTKNLEGIILRLLNGKMALYSIGKLDMCGKLNRMIGDISALIYDYKSFDKPLSESEKDRLKRRYDTTTAKAKEYFTDPSLKSSLKKMEEILDKLKSNGLDEEYDTVNRIMDIGQYISNSIRSNSINTVNDLRMMHIKIESISKVISNEHLKLSESIEDMLSNIRYNDSDSYHAASRIKVEEGIDKANSKIDAIENYIKSIL